jgi:hypothetical protein
MKSGQILSRNNSKMVLNIITVYRDQSQHNATGFRPLAEVTWTEAERRCAVVMILTRKGDILTDSEIADLTGVDCRHVNQPEGALTETRDPRQVVSRVPIAPMASRKVRKAPSHL